MIIKDFRREFYDVIQHQVYLNLNLVHKETCQQLSYIPLGLFQQFKCRALAAFISLDRGGIKICFTKFYE
jgi:hypothetical protein